MLLERRNVVGKAAEHDPERFGKAKLARIVPFHAKRGRHPAFALDAILERDALEVALPVIGPCMIDAAEILGIAARLQRDQGAAMGAAVLECVKLAV